MTSGYARADTAIRHVRHLDAGGELDHFAGEMRRGADAGGCEVELARISLCIGDELRERLYRQRQRRDDHRRRRADDRNRLQSLEEIVRNIRLQGRIGDERGIRQQHRIAVGRRARDHVGADHAAGARTILRHHRYA